MIAAQFIPMAATVFGMPETEIRTVDRALADAGMRQKSAGRNYPEMTRTEAVRLLIGVCAASKLTEAVNVVADLQRFTGMIPHPNDTDDAFCRASFRFTRSEAVNMTLIDALERLCGWLASPDAPEWVIEVEIEVGGSVAVQAHDWDTGRRAEIYFVGAQNYNGNPGIRTVRHVSRSVLKWIGANFPVAA